MLSNIKISSDLYSTYKGFDWPLYVDYLNSKFDNIPNEICNEIHSHEKILKHPINNINLLTDFVFTSQAKQDLFVVVMLEGKLNGSYLEIGAGHPKLKNNTYLLETKFNFTGTSIELDSVYERCWKEFRPKSNLNIIDAFDFNYSKLPKYIDYLQVDIEPAINNLQILSRVIDIIDFGVITFEHDLYLNTNEVRLVKTEAFKLLQQKGYEKIVNNVASYPSNIDLFAMHNHLVFEDWYINPKIVNQEVVNAYKDLSLEPKYADNILFIK